MSRKIKSQQEDSAMTAKNDYAITWPDLLTEPFEPVKGRAWTKVNKTVGEALGLTEGSVFVLLLMVEAFLEGEDEIVEEVLNKFPSGSFGLGDFRRSFVVLQKKGLLGDPTRRLRRGRDGILGAFVPTQGLMSYLLSGKSDFLELIHPKSKGHQDNLLRLALKCTEECSKPFAEPENPEKLYAEIAIQQANPLIKAMNKARYTLREQVTVLLAIGHRLNGKMEMLLRQLVDQTFDDPLEQLTTHNEWSKVKKLSQTLEERNLNRYFDRLKSLNMLPSLMVMLSGSPGTGKTELCRQLARLHQRDLVLVNLSAIRSKWYGETEKCVERLFSAIRATQDAMDRMPLVLFNEADSFFISRGKGGPSSNVSNTENTLVTMFLEMLERCEGLFLATTNHTESMDPAFERRWAFKLTVPNPDDETKFLLLQKSLGGLVKETTLRHWSQHYQFTGAQLRNVQRKLLLYHESDLTSELLEEILNQELNGWKISKPLHRAQIEGFRAA